MQENTNITPPPLHTNVGKKQAYYYRTISPTQIAGLADAILEKVFGFEQVPDMVTLTANAQGHFHFKAQFMYEDSIPFPQKRSTANKEKEKQKVKDIALAFFRTANEKVKANKQPKLENQDSTRQMFQDRDVDRGAFPSDFPDLFPIQYLEWQSTEPIFHPEYPKNIHYYEVRFRVELSVIAKQRFDSAQRPIIETPKTETVQNPETPVARLSSNASTNHAPQTQKLVDTFLGNATPTVKATVQNEYIVLHINPDDKRYEIMGVESHFVQIAGQETTPLLEKAGENVGLYFLQEGNLKVPFYIDGVAASGLESEAYIHQRGAGEIQYSQGITIKFDMLYIVREFAHEIDAKKYPEKDKITNEQILEIMSNIQNLRDKVHYKFFEKVEQYYISPFIERVKNNFKVVLEIVASQRLTIDKKIYWEPGGLDIMSRTFPSIIFARLSVEHKITSEKIKLYDNNEISPITRKNENIKNTRDYTIWQSIYLGVSLWHKGFYTFKLEGDIGYSAEEDVKVDKEKGKTGIISNADFEKYGKIDHFVNLNTLLESKSKGGYYCHDTQFAFVINHMFAEHLRGKTEKLKSGEAHNVNLYHDIYFYFHLIDLEVSQKELIFNNVWAQITNGGDPLEGNKTNEVIVEKGIDNSDAATGKGCNVLLNKAMSICFLKVYREWSKTETSTDLKEWKITRICILNKTYDKNNDPDENYEGGTYDIK